MLYIAFKESENTLRMIDSYFDFNYLDEWFDDDLVKEMIKDVDKSDVVSPNCIQSPVLGAIPPSKLSGGVKALILMLKQPELEVYATACGDNCAKWILEIAKLQDIHIVLKHLMLFGCDFNAYCVTTESEINSLDDYRRCFLQCL
ncbi:DUF4869 domain-containing protein [Acetivibrio ethanolgignens]|uniref:DUF4869 domain-containing protein n=1 Tax=Acetivibrio ethanolgignens TaxID=290052 RepID=A0A0V8QDS9_9FIRM|nr:DUF4869 domain-containing protein [Acetivibrio ethanolgignens]KSV58741.1 hypothetical protein ASU35_11805 [Acetivibrio ethanolgignens]